MGDDDLKRSDHDHGAAYSLGDVQRYPPVGGEILESYVPDRIRTWFTKPKHGFMTGTISGLAIAAAGAGIYELAARSWWPEISHSVEVPAWSLAVPVLMACLLATFGVMLYGRMRDRMDQQLERAMGRSRVEELEKRAQFAEQTQRRAVDLVGEHVALMVAAVQKMSDSPNLPPDAWTRLDDLPGHVNYRLLHLRAFLHQVRVHDDHDSLIHFWERHLAELLRELAPLLGTFGAQDVGVVIPTSNGRAFALALGSRVSLAVELLALQVGASSITNNRAVWAVDEPDDLNPDEMLGQPSALFKRSILSFPFQGESQGMGAIIAATTTCVLHEYFDGYVMRTYGAYAGAALAPILEKGVTMEQIARPRRMSY